jgi:biopolymer transport protein ExbD
MVVFSVFSSLLVFTLQFSPSRGIEIHLARALPNLPLAEPLVVGIGFVRTGSPPNLHLNSRLIAPEQLDSALRESLKIRPDWVVYVGADPDVDWQYVADIVDIIQSAHAKVVLLTIPSSDER